MNGIDYLLVNAAAAEVADAIEIDKATGLDIIAVCVLGVVFVGLIAIFIYKKKKK
jgi:hypothetical protein